MSVEITWMGHASFRISGGGRVVYIDPWKLTEAPHDADVVIVSHDHHDHYSQDDVAKVSGAETVTLAPVDTAVKLLGAIAIAPLERTTAGGVDIQAVAAYNVGKSFHPKAKHWIGAVITLEGKRIYYAGDTDLIDEMDDLVDVAVALLPVGGTYTLDAAEAACAAERIGCKAAVPYHWGDIVGTADDAEAFAAAACCSVTVLQPGESLTL